MFKKSLLLIAISLFSSACSSYYEEGAAKNFKSLLLNSSTPETNRSKIMIVASCVISSTVVTAYFWKKLFEAQENDRQLINFETLNVEMPIDYFSGSTILALDNENLYPDLQNNQNNEEKNKGLSNFLKRHQDKIRIIAGFTCSALLAIKFAKSYKRYGNIHPCEVVFTGACGISTSTITGYCLKKLLKISDALVKQNKNNSSKIKNFLKKHKKKIKIIGGITGGTLCTLYFARKYMTECLTFNLIDNYYDYAIRFCNGIFTKAQENVLDSYYALKFPEIDTGNYYALMNIFKTGKK